MSELITIVKLNLPFLETKKTLIYNTFKKATWDAYLITSIFTNARDEKEAINYINELVGEGSLKEYFLSLLNKIKNLNEETINRILQSSLFPFQKNDRDYSIKHYPNLNLSILEKNENHFKVLPSEYIEEDEFKKLIDENDVFVSVTNSGDSVELSTAKTYEILFNEEQVAIKMLDYWYKILPNELEDSLENKCENINYFQGTIESNPHGNEWKILETEMLSSFLTHNGFYNDGNWYIIEEDYLKEVMIAKMLDNIYFYKLNKKNFVENHLLAEKTLDYLLNENKIDEVKTKTLLNLFPFATDNLVQEIINNILTKKDSKDITLYGLNLLMNGLVNNWNKKSLEKMKNQASEIEQYQELYKINSNLFTFEWDKESILKFPDNILTFDHSNAKQEYNQNLNEIRHSIDKIIGEITTSGIREDLKKLPKNETTKKVKKHLNKVVGHSKKRYDSMSLEQLNTEYTKLNDFYWGDYSKVKKMINDKNVKSD